MFDTGDEHIKIFRLIRVQRWLFFMPYCFVWACSLVVTCWERTDLMALLYVTLSCVCHFPIRCPGSGVVLDCIDS